MTKEIKTRPRIRYTEEYVKNFTLEETYPKSKKFNDLSGQIFGFWKVLKYAGKEGGTQPKYFCLCTGCCEWNIQKVYGIHLKKGITLSCGCYRNRRLKESSNRLGFYHHQSVLNTFKGNWKLLKVIYENSISKYEAYCPECDTTFKINNSSVLLKSGGCRCTMKGGKGFDYDSPAYFYLFKIYNNEMIKYIISKG